MQFYILVRIDAIFARSFFRLHLTFLGMKYVCFTRISRTQIKKGNFTRAYNSEDVNDLLYHRNSGNNIMSEVKSNQILTPLVEFQPSP